MKRFAFLLGAALWLGLLCAACGGGSNSYSVDDIVDQTPQGTFDGQAWTMVSAVVEVDPFDEFSLDVDLYAEQVSACGWGNGASILFSIPNQVGSYPLFFDWTSGQTVTFYTPPGSNTIASEGIIEVESIDGTEITIGIIADAGDSFVNGRFTTQICP